MDTGLRRAISYVLALSLVACGRHGTESVASHPHTRTSPHVQPTPRVDEILARRDLAIKVLWTSPLGRKFHSYMFDALTPIQVTQLGNKIVERSFSNGGKSITYLSALQLLAEDLYESGQLNPNQLRRLDLLKGNLWQMQTARASYPGKGLAYYAAIAFFAALPLGSPQIRNALKKAIGFVARNFAPGAELPRLRRLFAETPEVRLSDFFSSRMLTDYQFRQALWIFFSYFGPFSTIYFFRYDWLESTRGHSIPEQLPTLSDPQQFKSYLAELSQL